MSNQSIKRYITSDLWETFQFAELIEVMRQNLCGWCWWRCWYRFKRAIHKSKPSIISNKCLFIFWGNKPSIVKWGYLKGYSDRSIAGCYFDRSDYSHQISSNYFCCFFHGYHEISFSFTWYLHSIAPVIVLKQARYHVLWKWNKGSGYT